MRQTYLSWWPEGAGTTPSFPLASRLPVVGPIASKIYSASPIRNQSYESDVALEDGNPPDHRVILEGLDEAAILDWWQGLGLTRNGAPYQGPLPAWHMTNMNCSTVVATALVKGGGERYAGGWSSWNLIWTPNDVLRFALSIQRGLAGAKR